MQVFVYLMSNWKGSSWDGGYASWESIMTMGKSWSSKTVSVCTMSKTKSWGGMGYSWDGMGDSWGGMGNKGGLGNGVSYLMGLGKGTGLVDGLFVGYFSSNWSNHGLCSKNGLLGKDWASFECFGDDWGWLDGSDGSWLVDMGVFSDWDGLVCDFWCDFGKSFSRLDGVSKVSSQSVVGDGSRVMCWGTNKVRSSNGCKRKYLGLASSQKAREDGNKCVHF